MRYLHSPLFNAETEDAGDMRRGIAREHNVRNSQISAVEMSECLQTKQDSCNSHNDEELDLLEGQILHAMSNATSVAGSALIELC